ncbi:MAG: hypothetical protein JJT81_20370 [Rubellimicrobium sp.]|nr:hypothetical protein [Rubellimicrobium sp.]
MAVTWRLLPEFGLVHVRYTGTAGYDESLVAIKAIADHPDFRPHFRHLADFRAIEAIETDYPSFLAFQARVAEYVLQPDGTPFVVYLADSPLSLRAVNMVLKSWEGAGPITAVVMENERDALDLLGLAGRDLGLAAP